MIGAEEDEGEKNGFFKTYHINVLRRLDHQDLSGISFCRNDEERLVFVHGLSYVHQMPDLMMSAMTKPCFKGKSKAKAQQRRTEGNRAFQLKDYEKAVRLYSAAILEAPGGNTNQEEGESELALGFANRSAALVHLSDHGRALIDIDQALESGYPLDLRFKLAERKAKCLSALHRPPAEVAEACRIALDSAANSIRLDNVKREQFNLEVKRLMEDALENNKSCQLNSENGIGVADGDVSPLTNTTRLPEVRDGPGEDYISLSKRIRVEQSPESGRYVVAGSHIQVGDILAVEEPYASVMNPKKYETHCHHCYKPLKLGFSLPCPQCSRINFCSVQCRTRALETYHATECRIIDCLYEAGISITCYLALRMIALHPPQFFINLKPVLDHPELQIDLSSDVKKYVATYNLVTHAEQRNKESFFHVTLMADFLLKCLKIGNYFGVKEAVTSNNLSGTLSEEERWIGSLLLRHIQLLQFNAHELAELQMVRPNEMEGAKAVFIGAAVYPTLSLFNHSCEPGVVRYCQGDTMIVRAIKTIGEGETINENYGPIFTQKEREERKQVLKERYWFDCRCTPCSENWPLVSKMSNDALRFRCSGCRRPLVVPVDVMTPFISCTLCKKSNNILQSLKALQDTEESFTRGRDLISRGEFESALKSCIDTLSQLDKILCPPYRDYIQCQEGARRCLLTFGNTQIVPS